MLKNSIGKILVIGGLVLSALLVLAYLFSKEVRKTASALPYFTFDPTANKIEKSNIPGQMVGEFSFIDQTGQVFNQEGIKNKVFVADYFFVQCPGICKEMATEMQKVYKAFESDPGLIILSHTSKPEEDSVGALVGYAKMYGATDPLKWKFLTGDKKELYQVARNQYFIVDEPGDGGEDDFIHTERFVLVDKKGYIRGYYDGTNSKEVDQLILDIRDLLLD